MKINPVSHEVLGGPLKPVYVYEAPVRFWHWAMVVTMFVLIGTGYLVGAPLSANYADTWVQYQFGYIRMAHFIAGFLFTILFIVRTYWAVVGNKYARSIYVPPVWNLSWWDGMFRQAQYYLFMRRKSPEFVGHNPLAQIAMFAMYVVGTVLIIITGFGLYAQQWGWDSGWMSWFGWVTVWFGEPQTVRTWHHVLMYYLGLFAIIHMYMAMREDIMGGATQLSTMTNGVRMFKEPVDGSGHH
ncbi:MAG: Ni/Fe-hydrogenase, b-type cytochrome subunit [Burkholderiaceae bacterium]